MSHFKRPLVAWVALFRGCLIALPRTRERKKWGRDLRCKPSSPPMLTRLDTGAWGPRPASFLFPLFYAPFPEAPCLQVPCAPYTLCCFSEEPHRLS